MRTKKERGFTLIEIMAALAVAGLVAAGAVFAFNTASERAEGNSIMQGMQPFMVDINNYLSIHYTDDAISNETLLSGDSSNKKDWDGSNNVDLITPSLTDLTTAGQSVCTSWGGTWSSNACTGTISGNPNRNLSRLVNLSSLRHYNGTDADGAAQWSLVLTDDKQLDIAFELTPPPSATPTSPVTVGNVHDALGCNSVDNTGLPDVAMNMLIAIEDIDVCQAVANGLLGYDSVQQAQCFDSNTQWEWSAPTGLTDSNGNAIDVDGDSVLGICFNVKQ